jgi:methionyl-tRNA synthetase
MPTARPKFFLTTAIDYPNSRPHIGTAFEKIGADVQARYRRMQGYNVFFLMGNDENTVKVAKKAAELGQDTQAYCDDMARQFLEVWEALNISYDAFCQTSHPLHHAGCRKFIQKVYDNGYIYKGSYQGWYCDGCESFKTEQEVKEANGLCPIHKTPVVKRSEPCYFFKQSAFQDRLLKLYEENPEFIQPESRRNEIIEYVKGGLKDLNLTRTGQSWGIRVPWDPEFTIYVWFDALLTYITGIGYVENEVEREFEATLSDDGEKPPLGAQFNRWWPCDTHFIGKDITRFHCALWPAMLWAAGEELPERVFGHGFVYIKNEETGSVEKISKSLGNAVEPMEIISKFSGEAFRYYFMRECPFPGDGEFSWQRFADVYNSELANNLGNLYSRVVTLVNRNYNGVLSGTAGMTPELLDPNRAETVRQIQAHVEACRYNQALQLLWQSVLNPANQHADRKEPWKLVKSDLPAAARVLFEMIEPLRAAAILLKPFIPRSAETIYRSFNFAKPWEEVRYEDAASPAVQKEDLRILAQLDGGKVKPLFPRIG